MTEYGYPNGSNKPPIPPNYVYGGQQNAAQPAQQTAPYVGAAQTSPYVQASADETPAVDAARPAYAVATSKHTADPAPKQRGSFGKTFLAGFLGAALACAVAGGGFAAYSATHDDGGSAASSNGNTTVLGSSSNGTINATDADDRAEAVADKVLPSVVGIDIYMNSGGASGWGSLFDSGSDSLDYSGLGSGVIISTDGYILTNNHVVEGADALKVTANGQEYDAELVGVDESSDLAVVKIDATDLTAIEIGDSSNLVPGQWVMTVGSPFGLEQSVATGIVSATSRTVTVQNATDDYSYYFGGGAGDVSIYSNMIQTDAAINPGNSGGALVDANGKLIGINAVIESYSGSYSGVGFAIPVDYAIGIAQQIIDGETPTHAQLGVSATTITSDIAARYDLGVDSGAYISAVYEGSAASEAGLKQGDIITAVDGSKVTDATDLVAACRGRQVGDSVTITFVRDGQEQTLDVTLGSDEQQLGGQLTEESSSEPEPQQRSPHGWLDLDDTDDGLGFGQGYGDVQDGTAQRDAAA